MPQLFPKWTNRLPLIGAIVTVGAVAAVVGFFWYYGSPWYTDVGYRPVQPAPYSHKLHAGDLGIDCRYCHTAVEKANFAGVPPTQTCMNCHKLILPNSEKLLKVRESWATGQPIEWVRIHHLPDYAYFDHSIHLHAGVGCESCHGNIANMDVVAQQKPLSMGWCLDCHRNPDPQLRRPEDVTKMNWKPGKDHAEFVTRNRADKNINPSQDCAICHR